MFQPRCLPILIGSLPLQDHTEAAEMILKYTPEIPLWPQLPKRNKEGMVRQFLTGFPGLIDEGKRFWIDTDSEDFADEMTSFYEEYLLAESDAGLLKTSRFALGADSAAGFAAFLDILISRNQSTVTLKGQITGPVTTGIGTKDRHGNSIFYNDNLRDMLIKLLSLKASWQVMELRNHTGTAAPIIFIDEPGMVSFGSSSFAGVSREMVTSAVGEVIEAIQKTGGLAGVHICANGDWGPALDSGADILSFDAYSYFNNIALYTAELTTFLKRGGILAWGIIPTGDPLIVSEENSDSLFAKWLDQLETLTTLGFTKQRIMEQTLIAPACGTGSLTLELAGKVLQMNRDVAAKCQDHLRQYSRGS
ncbi:uroporphyrinogen decarboxylase/cobalamine-independent methonine synthase family protein [Desulfopila aestuarii]|uniref:Methionine synthase II (Cobalamin-independent) n=1 Tax=Desulfopila aestuarii DSM 18488 TaxID=1121416 RepID=A0A1M7Y004_9BACT|nr:hypothetical protein [Desulfopila aestuarii]SHO44806.1 hypothetical protein SAMN02745220_00882 [Desulfopila aestuarii DSM 18488]